MCAIFGIFGEYNPRTVRKMARCQLSRGPDKTSFYFNKKKKVSLGMNRLAVIDKKNGKQPMISYDKKILTIFNGTIYNFKEIKKFLKSKSIEFSTNSDTELLTNSYAYWGDKCFNYFDGMWAAAFYDIEKNNLSLSRDYLGQKPLYYSKDKNITTFSSQIEGIFEHKKNFKLSKNNLDLYYRFSHLPAPYTIYKDIYKVETGQIITVGKKIKKKIYWDLSKGPDQNIFFKKISRKNVKGKFDDNLKNYLISDKNPIIALSSGKDSQIIKNSVKKIKNVSSLTIGFKNSSFDESKFISRKTNKSDIKILDEKKALKIFKQIIKKLVFFNGDGSFIPTYYLFNEIKKKTNVSLSGDGGDEIFFGYITFKAFYLLNIIKKLIPNFFLNLIKKSFNFNNFSNNYLNNKKKISLFIKHLDKDLAMANSYWLNDFEKNEINLITGKKTGHKIIKKIKKIYDNNTPLRFAQIYYFKFYLPMVLEKVDCASMLNSVESRAPLLTKDLINFTLSYSENKNFNLFEEKKLMKNIFNDRLNKKFKNIKKHGFSFQKSLVLKNKKFIEKLINPIFLTNKNFFKKKYKEYLKYSLYENYIWNEVILNISRQNLEKK